MLSHFASRVQPVCGPVRPRCSAADVGAEPGRPRGELASGENAAATAPVARAAGQGELGLARVLHRRR